PRAKTILIASFFILNVLLAYNLYIEPLITGDSDNISRERFDSIMNVLGQNDVTIDAEVPRNTPRLAFYQVSLHPFTTEEIFALRNGLLGPDAAMTSISAVPDENNPAGFMLGQEDMAVTALGYLSYYNRDLFLADDGESLAAEDAQALADTFLQERFPGLSQYTFDSVTYVAGMGHRVEYVQQHDQTPVYPGHVMVLVKSDGVVALWQLRLQVIAATGQEKKIVSAADALMSMLSHRLTVGEPGAVTVRQIELGYYSRVYDTFESWQTAPVWRVRTDHGDYFINAHSGIIEE
ncbi:MAG TPA: two-component system regulatory protein YycI, partial [Bacillota bacterium]|nr:two-component system regulatory protein YycI [Bacillota bacterium]